MTVRLLDHRKSPESSREFSAIFARVIWMCLKASTPGGLAYSLYRERFAQSRRTWNRDLARLNAAGVPLTYVRSFDRYFTDRDSLGRQFARGLRRCA